MSIYEYDEEKQRRFDKEEGMERLAKLIEMLIESGESELVLKVTKDRAYREELFENYNL